MPELGDIKRGKELGIKAQRITQLEAEIVLLGKQLKERELWLEDRMITRG